MPWPGPVPAGRGRPYYRANAPQNKCRPCEVSLAIRGRALACQPLFAHCSIGQVGLEWMQGKSRNPLEGR